MGNHVRLRCAGHCQMTQASSVFRRVRFDSARAKSYLSLT